GNAAEISGLAAECAQATGDDPAAADFCARLAGASQSLSAQAPESNALTALAAQAPAAAPSAELQIPSVADVITYLRQARTDIDGLVTNVEKLNGQLGALPAGGARLLAGADGLAAGTRGLAGGIDELAVGAQDLAGGAGLVSQGAGQLAQGTGALASGAQELNAGVGQLTSNIPMLVDGTVQLHEGSEALATGARAAHDGQRELATGLGTAVESIPTTTEDERINLAEVAVTPVVAEGDSDEIFNASGVPLFAAIALWAGALASFLLLAPVWHRTRDAARGVGWITARSALPALVTGAAQGLVVGIAMPIALSLDASAVLGFAGLSVLAGIVFALVNQGFVALLRGWGRFLSLVMLVLAFAAGIVSTAPGVLSTLAGATPLAPAIDGFQAIASGASGAGSAAGALVLWAIIGAGLLGFAVRRERVQTRVLAPAF
ncbi:YhgE/Pip domain-containing protein, partial [Leucobacter sp. M11]|nr:YhgE/Pip domain-containing protein [Leucobacter sp. M11]